MKTKLKTKFSALTLGFYLLLFPFNSSAQNVGINETGAAPDESALLDLNATDKGFLITRADTADINSPAFGLMTLAPIDSCLYMQNGKPSGETWISIGGVGYDCPCNCSDSNNPPSSSCGKDNVTQVIEVVSGNGRIWMDRNLGASQVAESLIDPDAYGDLYQWGRCSDGHEKRNSGTNPTRSSTDDPGHGNFINVPSPLNWRDPPNTNLWQGVNGINNPCPTGFRLPTKPEYEAEISSWGAGNDNPSGAYDSPLKLTTGGDRNGVTADLTNNETTNPGNAYGYYWTSDITTGGYYNMLRISNLLGGQAVVGSTNAVYGLSVRCIKDN